MQRALIIFVKYPEPGTVKSRLGMSIGNNQAAEIYKCFTETVLVNVKDESYKTFIFFAPAEKENQIKDWLGADIELIAQNGNDLGKRLVNAFNYVFEKGVKQAIVIGTDCPLIKSEDIVKAFNGLEQKDWVIGPASDGGYYLLGLKRSIPELFKIDEWSTDAVFKNTMKRADNLALETLILEENFDIDESNDLLRLKEELKNTTRWAGAGFDEIRANLKKIKKCP